MDKQLNTTCNRKRPVFSLLASFSHRLNAIKTLKLPGAAFIFLIVLPLFYFVREIDERIDIMRKERMASNYTFTLHEILFLGGQTRVQALDYVRVNRAIVPQ